MDLDVGLVEPILVLPDEYCLLKLLVFEPRVRSGLAPLQLLFLLIIAVRLLGALLADAIEEPDEFLIAELQTHPLAVVHEVLLLDAPIVVGVEYFVGHLYGGRRLRLRELGPKLAEQGVLVVLSLSKLQAASVRKCSDHAEVVCLLNIWL